MNLKEKEVVFLDDVLEQVEWLINECHNDLAIVDNGYLMRAIDQAFAGLKEKS